MIWATIGAIPGGKSADIGAAVITEAKLGYLLGQASGRAHNIERALQNATQLGRVDIHDTAVGRALLPHILRGL